MRYCDANWTNWFGDGPREQRAGVTLEDSHARSRRHLGIIQDGVEDSKSEHGQAWAGAEESYSIKESGGVSTLTVEMETTGEYRSYFEDVWPKALAKLKEIAEK